MTATVYHARYDRRNRDLAFTIGFEPTPETVKQALYYASLEYDPVAKLNTDELEVAFEKTNTIDQPWWANDLQRLFKGDGCRSTSVGDVVAITKNNATTYYLCQGCGWAELPIDLELRAKVFEALNNRHENGYPLEGNYDVAVDMIECCADLENVENPATLDPYIQAWRHARLARDMNQMIKEVQS